MLEKIARYTAMVLELFIILIAWFYNSFFPIGVFDCGTKVIDQQCIGNLGAISKFHYYNSDLYMILIALLLAALLLAVFYLQDKFIFKAGAKKK